MALPNVDACGLPCKDALTSWYQVFQHLDATDLYQLVKGNPQLGTQVSPLRPSGEPTSLRLS